MEGHAECKTWAWEMGCERALPSHLEMAMTETGCKAQTPHTNLLCAYRCSRNKLKLTHFISCTAVTLVKWKITQNLIMETSCSTDTSPADPWALHCHVPSLTNIHRPGKGHRCSALTFSTNTRETNQVRSSLKFTHLTLETGAKANTMLVFIYKIS